MAKKTIYDLPAYSGTIQSTDLIEVWSPGNANGTSQRVAVGGIAGQTVTAPYLVVGLSPQTPQGRRLTTSSDITGTDGGAGSTYTLTLTPTGVSAGTYGSGSAIPQVTVDANGRITNIGTTSFSVSWASLGNVNASSLVGNPTGSPATASFITLGTTLAFSGTALQTAAHTGDVTTSANSFATTIAANAVTYAKFQQVTASRLLGNATGSLANAGEISLGATLAFSGSALQTAAHTGDVTTSANSFATTIAANAVTYAKFQQVAANSLVGNATGSLANATGITLGSTLAFSAGVLQTAAHTGDVTTSANSFATTIANNAVTNAKAAQMGANTIKGNNTAGTANAADLTVAQVNSMLGLSLGGTLTTGGAVTFSGAFTTTITVTANTTVTFPTTGTLATLAGSESLSNKTISAPVLSGTVTGTYTLGGTPTMSGTAITNATLVASTKINATGTPSATTFLCGNDTWATVTAGFTMGTPSTPSSVASVTFTGIPSTAKCIFVTIAAVSGVIGGSTQFYLQLGKSGGLETSGYTGDVATGSAGVMVGDNAAGGMPTVAVCAIVLQDAATNTWAIQVNRSPTTAIYVGLKSLSGTLDRLGLIVSSGTFSATKINIAYI